mmetsp:Transcript_73602/g.213223  ORF Transcript_73602/g.213223 Transcript_73602/m.213223 type:complete len:204 (-) Transcript_73602:421-1032(-)
MAESGGRPDLRAIGQRPPQVFQGHERGGHVCLESVLELRLTGKALSLAVQLNASRIGDARLEVRVHRPCGRIVWERIEITDEDAHIVLMGLRPALGEKLGATHGLLAALLAKLLKEVLILEATTGDVGTHHIRGRTVLPDTAQFHPDHRAHRQLSTAPSLAAVEADCAGHALHVMSQNLPVASPLNIDLVAEHLVAQRLRTTT